MLNKFIYKLMVRLSSVHPQIARMLKAYGRFSLLYHWRKLGAKFVPGTEVKLIENEKLMFAICACKDMTTLDGDYAFVSFYEKDHKLWPLVFTNFEVGKDMTIPQRMILLHEMSHIDAAVVDFSIMSDISRWELEADLRAVAHCNPEEYVNALAPKLIAAIDAQIKTDIIAAKVNLKRLKQFSQWSKDIDFSAINAEVGTKITNAELSGK